MDQAAPGLLLVHRNTHPRYFGGIERKIITIVDEITRRGLMRCHLLTNHGDSPLADGVHRAGGAVIAMSMSGPRGLWNTARRISALADTHRISLVQTHTFWASLPAGMVRRFRPSLRHLFRIHTHIDGSSISGLRNRIYHLADGINAPGVDHYCVLSTALRNELVHASRIAPDKISILMNGVPTPGDIHPIREDESGLAPGIAVVGDLQPRKRQDLVIEAVAITRDSGVDIPCRLIGLARGDYGERLADLVAERGVGDLVEFVGYQDPVTPWLDGIEVMVLQSDFEGIPTCMVEAMGLGMLAISSDVGGTSDLIDHGRNGFLVPPGDAQALARTLLSVFATPSRELADLRRAGLRVFGERCSTDAMISGLIDRYRALGVLPSIRGGDTS